MKCSVLFLSFLSLAIACGDDDTTTHGGNDGGSSSVKQDAGRDASSTDPDASMVVHADAAQDAALDASAQSTTDASVDTGLGGDADTGLGDDDDASVNAGGGVCRDMVEGIYSVKVQIDAWWMDEVNDPNTPTVDPGRGKIDLYFRTQLSNVSNDGSDVSVQLRPCGMHTPVLLSSASCTAMQMELPDALWDKPGIPTYSAQGSLTGFDVGDMLAITKSIGLLGISLNDPSTFPTAAQTSTFTCTEGAGAQCFPDIDADGTPGVTASFRTDMTTIDGPYLCNAITPKFTHVGLPLDLLGTQDPSSFGKTAAIGLKNEIGGSSTLKAGCESGVGNASTSDTLVSRALRCTRRNDTACSVSQETFVDTNMPVFHVLGAGETPPAQWKHLVSNSDGMLDRSASVGPKISIVRVADIGTDITCSQVRGAALLPFD